MNWFTAAGILTVLAQLLASFIIYSDDGRLEIEPAVAILALALFTALRLWEHKPVEKPE